MSTYEHIVLGVGGIGAAAAYWLDIDDAVELFHRVNQQDFAASEWCQPNMRSRAYAHGGVLVPTEQEIIGRWYYRWYRESMGLGESL
jgi:phenylpropionate dioxygenase-like ring-hydroxylating dioxygenase large terminal subunit